MNGIFVHNAWIICVLTLLKTKDVVTDTENGNISLSLQNDVDTSNRLLDLKSHIPEDGLLNFTELAIKYGYQCKEYDVITEDGYILKIFNVPGNKSKPILLMHGLLDSADTFIIRGHTSLAIVLADAGYDVWLGNCRGNKYARRHTFLDPDDVKKEFWDFSFHEFGVYDIPATIDFVLKSTKREKIPVIGHSQGNLLFYILGSEKPEYNDKVEILIALAPICHLNHVKELSATLVAIWPGASAILKLLGVEEMFRADSMIPNGLIKLICTQTFGYDLCARGAAFPVAGKDPEELEPEFFSVVIGHFLAGTSRKDADHQWQLATKKEFTQFDYGVIGNLHRYGSVRAPLYDLGKVTMPVAMLAGKNDNIAVLEDVERLRGQLPNVVYHHVMERDMMNHISFVWGKNMGKYLFPLIFDLLQHYD